MFSSGIAGREEFKSIRGASVDGPGALFWLMGRDVGLLSATLVWDDCVEDSRSVQPADPEVCLGL